MTKSESRTWYAQRRLAIQQANVLSLSKQQQHRAIKDPLHGQLWVLLNAVTRRIVDSEGMPLDSLCPCGSPHQDPTKPCQLERT